MKNIVTVTLKGLVKLYNRYLISAKAGRPRLLKHIKYMLIKEHYKVVRTKKALIVRGIVLNTEKLKVLFRDAAHELVQFFADEYGLSVETYESKFVWTDQRTDLVSLYKRNHSPVNDVLNVMRPIDLLASDAPDISSHKAQTHLNDSTKILQ